MKNSVWYEYRNGVRKIDAATKQRLEAITGRAIEPRSFEDEQLERVTGRRVAMLTWLCRWCQHDSPIGMVVCDRCGMPRPAQVDIKKSEADS
jgi:hypothetical protein